MPLHPSIVHFPIVLTFIMPVLIIYMAWMIKSNRVAKEAWFLIVGLQVLVTATGYISLETGESEEHAVEKVLDKRYIHKHEEAAEVFVGTTVLALVISIAAIFILKKFQIHLHAVVCVITLVSGLTAYRAGQLGGELVYKHGAATAYRIEGSSGLLPTPGMNTSESSMPIDDNESFKADDSDYGNAEGQLIEDEERLDD